MQFARNTSIIISYMKLRALIGILGMALPVLCFIWCCLFNNGMVADSISIHYYTNFRDIFVGILISVSVFLITYRGYTVLDNGITNIIGLFGLGIALFPCGNDLVHGPVGIFLLDIAVSNVIHLVSASTFFTLLAVNSLFLFTKSNTPVQKGSKKWFRNLIYRLCGVMILVSLVAIIPAMLFADTGYPGSDHGILILETIMLFSFGISWLVKGGTLLGDKPVLDT